MSTPESFPLGLSLDLVDAMDAQLRADPRSVEPGWAAALNSAEGTLPAPSAVPVAAEAAEGARALRVDRLQALVEAYRVGGHREARLDPLADGPPPPRPELDPATYGFTEADLDVPAGRVDLRGLPGTVTLRQLTAHLRATYCRSIGVELMHISDGARRSWLLDRMEPTRNETPLDRATQLRILDRLAAAEVFERFIHTRWVGAKRFGIDGAETLIPLMNEILERAAEDGVVETVIGMPHRGRLNVLANILGKSAGDIFTEFEDIDPESVLGGGDVKYHLGYSSDFVASTGRKMHLSLAFNPSHLEAVDAVVVGRVRAKQRRIGDVRSTVMGLLLHGDAAFAGQGLVTETIQLSQIRGYLTGGTVHVIVNNQIGFTTNPSESRSTTYCSDVARMIECPIFHVNGEDAEAVAHVVRLAVDYRRTFGSDVVIDMYCFRRYGHNESDEPSFTQPLLYKKIERHPSMRTIYGQQLIARGVVTQADVDRIVAERMQAYEAEYARAKTASSRPRVSSGQGVWAGYVGGPDAAVPEVLTGVAADELRAIAQELTHPPETFHAHPKIQRLLGERAAMGRGERPVEWNMAELLAFGSLVRRGTPVRLSGQDCSRGTFSQRHAVLTDVENGEEYLALRHLPGAPGVKPGTFRVYDSPLSEAGVLGFEFGYSLDCPEGLVIWEAQFGDFVNGAQVIIDQFIASSEDKWRRISGVTLFLPHGYEGQGPEHSSARFERFLQLCAEDNIQVCQPTSAAQLFHLLRRQVLRPWRKPLVVLTPKSLLRGARSASPLSALAEGRFQRVLVDAPLDGHEAARCERLLLCTGKVCYDLLDERAKRGAGDVAIARVEQMYPLVDAQIAEVLARFPRLREVVWVQDEPENMGARNFVLPYLERAVQVGGQRILLRSASRLASASPATGSARAHAIEQRRLLDEAFAGEAPHWALSLTR